MGAAGRERALAKFTWQVTAQGTVEQYRALLAERAALAGAETDIVPLPDAVPGVATDVVPDVVPEAVPAC
jgi:hypothetical protein